MKSSDKIHALMASLQANTVDLIGTDVDALYTHLQAVIGENSLLCFPFVYATHHANTSLRNGDLTSATTVDVEFTFTADDGSTIAARTTGVHIDTLQVVTNYALLQARKHALLSVFGLLVEVVLTSIDKGKPERRTEAVDRIMSQAGLGDAVTTADKVEPPKPKPPVPTVRPAESNLPVTPTLTAPASALTPEAKAVADWIAGIDTLNPEAPGEWDVHRARLKSLRGVTADDLKDLFDKLRVAGWNLGVDYDNERKMFFLAEPATADIDD